MSSEQFMVNGSSMAILCENLGKCYHVYDNPMARLKQALWRGSRTYYHEFWALRSASFEVNRGESLGIIGRNGSGKSTLLQLIAGTLTPSEGTVQTQGRVAALLELGSGFNPEFSGLENIHLNATMLGLGKQEIEDKIDDILAFAEIGTFIDQPVKTYSSGMTVRLAFAVATALDPDILIIDEALSVGDSFFTNKCRKKMISLRDSGATMIVVSHDLEQLAALCDTGLVVSKGTLSSIGPLRQQIHDYLSGSHLSQLERDNDEQGMITHASIVQIDESLLSQDSTTSLTEPARGEYLIDKVWINDHCVQVNHSDLQLQFGPVTSGDKLQFILNNRKLSNLDDDKFSLGILIQDINGQSIWSACELRELRSDLVAPLDGLRLAIEWPPLRNGIYYIVIGIGSPNSHDPHDNTPILWDADHVSIESTGQSVFSTAIFNGKLAQAS